MKSLSLYLGLYAATATAMLVVAAIQWNGLVGELAVAEEALQSQEASAEYYKAEVGRQSDRYSDLMRNRSKLQEVVFEQQAQIDRYMGREDVVYAKPGLVERLEKRAMDKFFKELDSDDN